jgi:hypothetical protein
MTADESQIHRCADARNREAETVNPFNDLRSLTASTPAGANGSPQDAFEKAWPDA